MEFVEIVSEIKLEPETFHMDLDTSHLSDEPLVGTVEVGLVEASVSISSQENPDEDQDDMYDNFCDRIQEAVAEGEARCQEDQVTPKCSEHDIKSEQPSPASDDLAIQDSGGVFKDHNYSLFKDVNPVDQLLMTYYLSMEKDATINLSENNQNVCKILELLGTIVSTSSSKMISGAIGMIESHTSQMRTGVSEVKESPLEKVYSEIEYLRGVRELGQFLTSESDRLAASLLKQQQKQEQQEEEVNKKEPQSDERDVTDEPIHSCDHLMAQLKRDVNEKLTQFRASQFEYEEIATQTEPPPIVPREEISCQTDPLPEPAKPPPASQTVSLKYFTSSDMETDSSMSAGAKRTRRRKKKKEMLAEFFGRTEGLDDGVAAAAEKKRKERTKVRVTGSDDEIDRLVNFNNLDRDYEEQERGSTTVNGPKTEAQHKKKGETADDILNGIEIDQESSGGDGEEATDERTEEKMFLKKLNLEHKRLLLNSSSSEAEQEVDKCESGFEALLHSKRVTVQDSGEDSEIEETVDLFLTDFKVPAVDEQMEKEKRERKRKHSIDDSTADGVEEQAKQRRDSFDKEMAKLLKDTSGSEGDETDEQQKKEKNKRERKEAKDKKITKPVDENDGTLPLDLSDTAGKRSRNESLDRSAEDAEMGLLLDKRKQVFMNAQSVEKLDAAVLKAHQSTRNPLLMNRPNPVPSPAVSSVTSRDPDCISVSSSSSIEELAELDANATKVAAKSAAVAGSSKTETPDPNSWKQRNTRKMMSEDKLDINTKKAQRDESERIKRLERKHDVLKKYLAEAKDKHKGEIILDVDPKTKQVVRVHPEIVKYLKEHQEAGIKFLYDCAYGSIVDMSKHAGSGCILAHCMGLGKTLQQITVMHTVVQYPELKTSRILVICPKSTVMNWVDELHRWIGGIADGVQLKVFYIPDQSDIGLRVRILSQWHKCGTPGHPRAGVMLLGHEAFRILVLKNREVESVREEITTSLLNPGPDLVICDEGHVIKNPKSAISQAVSRIRTTKRIVLTGTPIQNNLKEYFCMVSFIKPLFLGTLKEFSNLYANPIKSGQHKDSTTREIKVMQQRSYVLHKKLEKFVQRREAGTLKQFLPEKFEYVIFVPLTQVQQRLYKFFLEQNPAGKRNGKSLISDYTFLRKIWTHPKVLESAYQNAIFEQNKQKAKEKERRRKSEHNAESEDDVPDDVLDKRTDSLSVTNDWWRSYLSEYDLESLFPSHKLKIMFEILKLARENGEKCLIFSAFVAVLNVVEYFMNKIHFKDGRAAEYGLENFQGPWVPGVDYYRLDGRTSKNTRHSMITRFNDPRNPVSTFLISAKAGGMGINLTGANRVIILDTSWNPSNDQQNIFRIFRLGQKRNCYVYRLLAMGTMEEKVYSRSVTKQALSYRVVDEQQIDRHYNMAELEELYVLSMPDFNDRPVPIRPADRLLANLVHTFPNIVFKYHIHDSLLENKAEENLSEAEKKEAWFEYEQQERRNEQPPPASSLPGSESFDYRAFAAQFSGYAGPPGGNPFLSMLSPNDPYLQLMYASQGMSSTNAFNSMLTGGNNYFTSGTLFPPEPVSGPLGALTMPPSPSGIGALGMDVVPGMPGGVGIGGGAKKGHKGGPHNKPSPFMQSLNFASLSQQLGYDLLWSGAQPNPGVRAGPVKPPAIGLGKGNIPNQQKAPPSPVPSRPGVVRIPTPPLPFATQRPPVIVGQNHPHHQQQQQQAAMPRKRPRILTKAPVTLPPSTTIEKLPLNTTQVPANAKAPILPSVPQSITVEKVLSGAKGPPAPPPQPKPPNRSTVPDKAKATTVLQPTAVIDLIDDVIDANPGLTVKPIKLPGPGMRRKTVVTGLQGGSGGAAGGDGGGDKGKQAKVNYGINYSLTGKGANKPATAAVEDVSFPWTGETVGSPQDAGAKKRPAPKVPAPTALNTVPAPKTVLSVHPPKRPTAAPTVAVPITEQIEARKKAVAAAASTQSTVRGALKGILKTANPSASSPRPPVVPLPLPIQRSATSVGIIRVPPKEGAAGGAINKAPPPQPSPAGQRVSLPNQPSLKLVRAVAGASKATTNEGIAKRLLEAEKRAEDARRWSSATTAAVSSKGTPPLPGILNRSGMPAKGTARLSLTSGVKNGGAGLLPGAPPALKLADSFISQQQKQQQQQQQEAKKATTVAVAPVKEVAKRPPQMKTVSIQQKGSDGSPGQQMPPVRLPVLAMTSHASPKSRGAVVQRPPATQFTLKPMAQQVAAAGVGGAARLVKGNSTSSQSPQKAQTQPSPGQAAQTVQKVGVLKRVQPPMKMGIVPSQATSSSSVSGPKQQSSPVVVGQKRTANVAAMSPNLGPTAKKSSTTPASSSGVIVSSGAGGATAAAVRGASASSSSSSSGGGSSSVPGIVPTPQQSNPATNLTVIQKNLQKRQNGSFS